MMEIKSHVCAKTINPMLSFILSIATHYRVLAVGPHTDK